MEALEKYELVNSCETVDELAAAILKMTDSETGRIKGRVREFNGADMAASVQFVVEGKFPANALTREYGIRQQALYLRYCHTRKI